MPQVTMPQLGEGVEEGTIGKWLKAVGDHVRVGDPLVEVVTDKVNAEVPSPFEGTLSKVLVQEGETVRPRRKLRPPKPYLGPRHRRPHLPHLPLPPPPRPRLLPWPPRLPLPLPLPPRLPLPLPPRLLSLRRPQPRRRPSPSPPTCA